MSAGKIESDEIKKATVELEQGHADTLRNVLHGHSQEERIEALQRVRNQFQQDKATNPQLPDVSIETNAWIPANSNEVVSVGGRPVFASVLDINTLTRQDYVNGKPVGPRERTVDSQPKIDVRALTDKLEAGDGKGAHQLLSGLSQEERIQAMQYVRDLNGADLKDGRSDKPLSIAIMSTKLAENVISVSRTIGIRDALFGGTNIYFERFSPGTGKLVVQDQKDNR